MNKKILYPLIGVFIILLLLTIQPIWSKYLPQNTFFSQDDPSSQVEMPVDITSIEFKFENADRNISLNNQDGIWKIEENFADKTKINQLLSDLNSMRFDEVVSQNQEKFSTYGASESGDQVIIKSGSGDQVELIVGEKTSQQGSVYIKPADIAKVFLVKSNIFQFLGYNKDDWRDKILVDWSEEEIQIMTLTQRGQVLTLSRSEAEGTPWQITRNQDSRIMGDVSRERFFDTFSPFEATGIASEAQTSLFNRGTKLVIKLINIDETERTLELVEDQNNSVWIVKVDNQDDLFTISSAKVQLLLDTTFKVFE